MRTSHLALMAILAFPGSASAAVITLGAGYAQSCYSAAEARDADRQALDACNRALTEQALVQEDRVATHINRGILQLERMNVGRANADFDAALKLDPRAAEAWLNKAVALARFGKSTDALPFVAKALEYGTSKPALAYFVRAMANEDSGNITAAYNDLKRAQSLAPNWKEPEVELRRFQVRSKG